MTVAAHNTKIVYAGDGATTSFTYDFRIFREADLKAVTVDPGGVETPLVQGSDYAVSGAGDPDGGTVTCPVSGQPLPQGHKLVLYLELDYLQGLHLPENDRFPPGLVERALDRAALRDQQMLEAIDRAVKYPIGSVPDTEDPGDFLNEVAGHRFAAQASAQSAAADADRAETAAEGVVTADPVDLDSGQGAQLVSVDGLARFARTSGTANLVSNGHVHGFASGVPTGWAFSGTGVPSGDGSAARVDLDTGQTAAWRQGVPLPGTGIGEGDTLSVRFQALVGAGAGNGAWRVEAFDDQDALLGAVCSGTLAADGTWHEVMGQGAVPAGTARLEIVPVSLDGAAGDGEQAMWRGVSLVGGAFARPWSDHGLDRFVLLPRPEVVTTTLGLAWTTFAPAVLSGARARKALLRLRNSGETSNTLTGWCRTLVRTTGSGLDSDALTANETDLRSDGNILMYSKSMNEVWVDLDLAHRFDAKADVGGGLSAYAALIHLVGYVAG